MLFSDTDDNKVLMTFGDDDIRIITASINLSSGYIPLVVMWDHADAEQLGWEPERGSRIRVKDLPVELPVSALVFKKASSLRRLIEMLEELHEEMELFG